MPTKRQLDPEIVTVFFPEDGQPHAGINKTSNLSRWWIGDIQYDDLVNFLPQGVYLQQVPAPSAVIATLAAPAIWISAQSFNQACYIFALCNNGAIYQVSLGGVITTVTGPGTVSANCDIANWQGTQMLFSDLNASKIYAWNGSTFTTVFSSQPAQWITVYSNRLWLANQGTVTFTAGGTYNNLGGDGSSFTITEMDCEPPIRLIFPYGGNLYIGGYNWIRIYGGLYDTGAPAVLQFQTSTLTDEAGIYTKWSFIGSGYSVLYSSLYAIWNLMGSQAAKISTPIDGFYQFLSPGSSLSAAWGQILGTPCLMWNFQYSVDSTYRIACMVYDNNPQNQIWFTLNQGNISFITWGVDQTNGQQKVWGVDTAGKLYQICGGTTTITSQCNTKLWSFGHRIREKSIIRAAQEVVVSVPSTLSLTALDENLNQYTPDLRSLSPTTTFIWNNNNQTFNWDNSGAFTWSAPQTQYSLMEYDLPITVKKLALNSTMTGVGGVIGAHAVEYYELPADFGH